MQIALIIVKKLNGTLSITEQKCFDNWIQESDENKFLFSRLHTLHNNGHNISKVDDINIESAWNNVLSNVKVNENKSIRSKLAQICKYAAIFIGLFITAFLYWQTTIPLSQQLILDDSITLELENGEIQQISTENIQTITNNKGKVLGVQNGIQINYFDNSDIDKLTYNVLKVPHGKTFKLILSDSTIVYLNAGSSLKYPVKFIKDQNRQVFLTGEAYFDVNKDKAHAFIVTNGTMDVRVLGTKFNISAYPEDQEINTVLVEGSVSLYNNENDYNTQTSNLLKPNHKASWNRTNDNVIIETVDTDIYTSWIAGKLVIKKMPFKNIIQKLQRHYKVTINNNYEQLDNQIFTANFDTESIEDVLSTFILETHFEYSIKDNTIEIYKPTKFNTTPME
ncbi:MULTISPECIES: FecR family protein [unclassified Arenibacter]|uniref:FecR family protein n=1 Tax=unclassified Arenibacter TaxID=2615047 RepID=UPI000E343916|nr:MULTISPECIES: FecR family protein [unclassified Arenibacter]MCM4162661.1 iron dicitrate transport regulator FecR [Arenibacter sp. A80]RFT58226.1 FecR family protein [Arenibacter sp. P308M17]